MTWQTVASIVGSITGGVSILGLIYVLGWKFGSLETKITGIEDRLKTFDPIKLGELSNKVETLYQVYVLDALSQKGKGKKSNPHGGNPGPEEEKVETELPDELLQIIRRATHQNLDKSLEYTVTKVVEEIGSAGPGYLITITRQLSLSPNELILRISDEVERIRKEQGVTE